MMASPDHNCQLCPRLAAFRTSNRTLYPDFYNNPVSSFGDINAKLLIVGLAPGLKGANATGRPFTGDFAGDILYQSLIKYGFAKGHYQRHADDGLQLRHCRITNAVRCVPPENKPTPIESATCRPFLADEIASMPNLKIILTLGCLSHNSILKTLSLKAKDFPFGHGQSWDITWQHKPIQLLASYHTSRYNIQTNRLSQTMFDEIIGKIEEWIS